MKNKDLNTIVAIEKAIAKKYGEEAIANPNDKWDEEKEKKYLNEIKEMNKKVRKNSTNNDKITVNGIKVSKKLFNRDSASVCPVCSNMAKKTFDDVCILKYGCCGNCYIQYVEGREERWLSGWRPIINEE